VRLQILTARVSVCSVSSTLKRVLIISGVSDSHSVSPAYNSLEDRVKGKSPRGRFMNSYLKSGYLTLLYY